MRGRLAVVDVGAQRVKRHPPLAVPFGAGDFGAAETAAAADADALRAEPDRRLHRPLHGAAEGDAALKLLRDRLRDEMRVDLRLPDFDDVDVHLGIRHRGDLLAKLLDVGALLADDDARPRGVNGDAALLVRTLHHDARHRRLLQVLHQRVADADVLVQEIAVLALLGEPAGIPGLVDPEAEPDRIDFLSHALRPQVFSSTSRTTTVRLENGFRMRPTRPRARGLKRFITSALPTCASATMRLSTSS